MKQETFQEFLDKFDHFRRTGTGSVVIRPCMPHGLIELKEEFIQKLKKEMEIRIKMVIAGIEEPSAVEQFVIYILEDAY
jgi:metal-dependent hydrolase (beta-lactamase superfamily II)